MRTKIHLYEFKPEKHKLRCMCGWEKTVRKADTSQTYRFFSEHCAQQALLKAK